MHRSITVRIGMRHEARHPGEVGIPCRGVGNQDHDIGKPLAANG